MEEKEVKYGLSFNYPPSRFEEMFNKIQSLLQNEDIKDGFHEKKMKMLGENIDLTSLMIWMFENYPESVRAIEMEPEYVKRFK